MIIILGEVKEGLSSAIESDNDQKARNVLDKLKPELFIGEEGHKI